MYTRVISISCAGGRQGEKKVITVIRRKDEGQ